MKKISFIIFILLNITLFAQAPIAYANEVVYDFMDNYVGPCSAAYGCESQKYETKELVPGYGYAISSVKELAIEWAFDQAVNNSCVKAKQEAEDNTPWCPLVPKCREAGHTGGCNQKTWKPEDACETGSYLSDPDAWKKVCKRTIYNGTCVGSNTHKIWPYYAECTAKSSGDFTRWCQIYGSNQCIEEGIYYYPQGPAAVVEGFLDLYNETMKSQEKENKESPPKLVE